MAPKAKGPPAGGVPTPEDEVAWPADVQPAADPPFYYAVAHIYGHAFHLEGHAEHSDTVAPLREFDPCAQLFSALKEESPEDPLARQVVPTDRDELQGLAEGGSLAHGLRVKAEKESAARKRRKTNLLRTKVIADHEASAAKVAVLKEKREAFVAAGAERREKLAEHEAAVAAAVEAEEAEPEAPVFDESFDVAKEALAEADAEVEADAKKMKELAEAEAAKKPEVVDFVLAVFGYPDTAEELQELRDEGIVDVPDLWLTTYLSGENVREEILEVDPAAEPGTEAPPPRHITEVCKPPEILTILYDAIHAADLASTLANATICTIPDCHELAPPAVQPEGADTSVAALVAAVRNSILKVLSQKCERRKAFQEWMGGVVERSEVPVLKKADSKLYVELVSSVDPARHDVPLLLHCMCEQVAQSLAGDQHDGHGPGSAPPGPGVASGEDEELSLLDIYLDDVHKQVISGNLKNTEFGGETAAAAEAPKDPDWKFPGCPPEGDANSLMLPFLDRAGCTHTGDEFPGHIPVDEAVQRVWSHGRAPGVKRTGFPEEADDSTASSARRCAQRNRIYSMMPETPIVVFEKLLLLDEFERLLNNAQPERSWQLQERVFHERVPKELVIQVLLDAFRSECFVETSYIARHDCLLIALYHRCLPARMLWHGWAGDHLAPSAANTLRTVPTFNDWCHLVAPRNQSENASDGVIKRQKLLALDSRELGYCKVMEKLLTPSDSSLIVRTRLQRGLKGSFEGPPEGGDLPARVELEDDEDKEEEEDELGLSLGLGETKKMPKGEDDGFEPPPKYQMQSARVVKEQFTFGMVTDQVWGSCKPRFAGLRQAHETAEAEAAAAAQEEAARLAEEAAAAGEGGEAAEEVAGDEANQTTKKVEVEKEEISVVRLENLNFGIFWLVFQDGSRCSCRIHHERPFWPDGGFVYDIAEAKPGVLFTYSPNVGLTVQVFSDGTVRQTWPPELRGPNLAGNLRAQSSSSTTSGVLPGGPEDCEVARTVTPFGSVVRELLSGRREIYHPDGTCAARNPTVDELRTQCERWRRIRMQDGPLAAFEMMNGPRGMQELQGPLAYLEAVLSATMQLHTEREATVHPDSLQKVEALPTEGEETIAPVIDEPVQPSEVAKSAGIPGHWRICRPDGSVYGRADVPPEPPAPPSVEKEEAPDGGEGGAEPAASPSPDGEAEDGEPVVEVEVEPPHPWEVVYAERLGGYLIDNDKMVEYQIQAVSTTEQLDPHTAQRITTNDDGLLTFEDDAGGRQVCMHADGTRQIWEETKDGYRVSVERERVARVSIDATVSEFDPCVNMVVECPDGTRLEVIPRRLNEKGELVPADPTVANPLVDSTNASILLRRKDGSIVYSRGSGEINVASGFDIASRGEKEILRTVETTGLYTAYCGEDVIRTADVEGNSFEVHGDQSVDSKLAVSMGDEYKSPRCTKPSTPFRHPHAAFLPLPDDKPEPRLFVVYGGGEAEELLLTRDAREALRLAKLDSEAVVVEGEQLGPPMYGCSCHTIFRAASSDAVSVPPIPITMPPSIAGFHSGVDAFAPAPGRSFTEFRQFIEYPPIGEEQLARFKEVLGQYHEREEKYQAQKAAYGQGLNTRQVAAVAPEVGGGA